MNPEVDSNTTAYVGKTRQLIDVEYSIDDLPEDDVAKIMQNLPVDDSSPPDAQALSQNDLRRELVDRGIQPKGFFNDDAARLQEEYIREHADARQARKEAIIAKAAKEYMQEKERLKNQELEMESLEEIQELADNARLDTWVQMVKSNQTPAYARMNLSLVGCRILAKTLAINTTLQTLNLSGNTLGDDSGTYVAAMLKNNTALSSIDIASNNFGPKTLSALATSIDANSSLKSLKLEENPLTSNQDDFDGISDFSKALSSNESLLMLNLWHTQLGVDGGKAVWAGIRDNDTIVCLDIGKNNLSFNEEKLIFRKLEENQGRFNDIEAKKDRMRASQKDAADRNAREQDEALKKVQHQEWLTKRSNDRRAAYEKQEAERKEKKRLDEEAQREAAYLYEAERRAKQEALDKKKSKKKKK